MRLVSFVHEGKPSCGAVEDDHILIAPPSPWPDLKTVLEADALADSLTTRLRAGKYSAVHQLADMAAFRARRGDAAGALEWLEESARVSPMIHYWHLSSGLFDRVREQPGFAAGVTRIEETIRTRLREERRTPGTGVE